MLLLEEISTSVIVFGLLIALQLTILVVVLVWPKWLFCKFEMGFTWKTKPSSNSLPKLSDSNNNNNSPSPR